MSAKQLARLSVILVVLLIVWLAAAVGRRREAAPSGNVLRLPRLTAGQVDTVLISRPKDTTLLAKRDSDDWTVNGHPAAGHAVSEFFSALGDSSAAGELVAERKASHAGLGVDSTGTRVQLKKSGKALADLVVGHRSEDFSGGYVRQTDQEPTYLVRGQFTELVTRTSDDWRNHQIAKVPADSIARIEISRGTRRYVLQRNGKGWELLPGGVADSTRVGDLLTAYSSVDATGFASAVQEDSAHFSAPDRRARLLRKDGTALLTLVFDSTAAGFWVRPDTSKTIYKVESWTADRLAPADSSLKIKKK
jgi:Domain of unknown function (DUF4340)